MNVPRHTEEQPRTLRCRRKEVSRRRGLTIGRRAGSKEIAMTSAFITKFPKKLVFALLVAILLCAAFLAIPITKADASAQVSAQWGYLTTVKGIPLYQGTYQVNVQGTGLYVNYVVGYPKFNTPICSISNWQITAEFFDINGQWYYTYQGPINWGTWSGFNLPGASMIVIQRNMKPGMMYSTLKQSGARLTSVGVQIK
jgi:hypothetical protein